MNDTGWTRRFRLLAAVIVTVLSLGMAEGIASLVCRAADEGEFTILADVRVVWARGPTVYLASRDTVALEIGTPIVLQDRGHRVAAGHITRIVDGTLAIVTLASGTLESIKKWDRLRVVAEPLTFSAPPLFRLGYPAARRAPWGGLQPCKKRPLPPGPLASAYRTESMSDRSWRGVRAEAGSATSEALWPDTLLVRLFDDSTDEEIALQRGEIDAAIFWWGEVSHFVGERWESRASVSGRWHGPPFDEDLVSSSVPIDSLRTWRRTCPIVTTDSWRGYVRALGADSLVNLLPCEGPAGSK